MDDTTKNELAELAKRLDIIVFGLVTDGHPCDETIDIRKAQRIIEELAKVRDTNWSAGHNYPEPNSSSVAVSNCRVIAEEGGAK